jgi:hypothetical protein
MADMIQRRAFERLISPPAQIGGSWYPVRQSGARACFGSAIKLGRAGEIAGSRDPQALDVLAVAHLASQFEA